MASKVSASAQVGRPALLGLLAECKANPDDLSLRLILADWLEEHGDEAERARAELIRIQVQRERDAPDESSWSLLQQRQRELCDQWKKAWEWPLRALGYPAIDMYRRGLIHLNLKKRGHRTVEALALLGSEELAWVEGFDIYWPGRRDIDRLLESPLFASVTCLRRIGVFEGDEDLARVADAPQAAHLSSLEFLTCAVTEVGINALVSSPFLTGLRSLTLHLEISEQGYQALASWPAAANLTSLELSGRPISNAGLRILAASPYLGNLQRLNLERASLRQRDLSSLTASPVLANLRHLDLTGNRIDAGALAAAPWLANLETLLLSNCGITSEQLASLSRARTLGNIRSLVLGDNEIASEGLAGLIGAGAFPRLKGLHLAGNPLRDAGAEALAAAEWPLEYLDLSRCRIGSAGLVALAGWPGLARVRTLDLSQNQVGITGIQGLVRSPWLGGLRWLDLSHTSLGGRAAQLLANCPGLSGLEHLNLSHPRYCDVAAQALIDSPHLANLKQLLFFCRRDALSDVNKRALRKRFGKRVRC